MPEYEVAWEISLVSNQAPSGFHRGAAPGEANVSLPRERDLLSAYRGSPGQVPTIVVTAEEGGAGKISISQRLSAGSPGTAARHASSGNLLASDVGIAHVLGDSTVDAVVSVITVTDTESGAVTKHDKGRHRPDDSDAPVSRPRIARRTRGRGRAVAARQPEVPEPEVAEPVPVGESVDEESV